MSRNVVLALLSRLQYRAEAVTNGREAVEAVARESFDVVLMDVHMPVLDGLDATRLIRATACETRIIGMSADASPEARASCLAAGMHGVVTKPLTPESLRRALENPAEEVTYELATEGSDRTVLDPAPVDRLRRLEAPGQTALVGELLRGFLADLPVRAGVMRTALAGGDLGRVAEAAHALRGTASTFGARRLTAVCCDLEEAARGGKHREVEALVASLDEEFAAIQLAIAGLPEH